MALFYGAPGGIRTPGLPVRSRTLYPAKLQAHNNIIHRFFNKIKIFLKTTCFFYIIMLYYISGLKNRGVAQLVARVVWDHEVAGSIPVTSTIKEKEITSQEVISFKIYVTVA